MKLLYWWTANLLALSSQAVSAAGLPECLSQPGGLPTVVYLELEGSLPIRSTGIVIHERVILAPGSLMSREQGRGHLRYGGQRYELTLTRHPQFPGLGGGFDRDIAVGVLDQPLRGAVPWLRGLPIDSALPFEALGAGCFEGQFEAVKVSAHLAGTVVESFASPFPVRAGDGGGPLYVQDADGASYLLGIQVRSNLRDKAWSVPFHPDILTHIRETARQAGIPLQF